MNPITVNCSGCGKDLTDTGNCVDWRIAVANEPIPCRDGTLTLIGINKKLESNMLFCSVQCLKQWVEKQ